VKAGRPEPAPLLAGIAIDLRAGYGEAPADVPAPFTDGEAEYRRAAVASRKLAGGSRRETGVDVAAVTRRAEAQRLADIWLQELWAGRETAEFELTPCRGVGAR
jgi:hypothetical protein